MIGQFENLCRSQSIKEAANFRIPEAYSILFIESNQEYYLLNQEYYLLFQSKSYEDQLIFDLKIFWILGSLTPDFGSGDCKFESCSNQNTIWICQKTPI